MSSSTPSADAGGVSPVTLVMIADLAPGDVAAFQSYEAAVLPLLAGHGGRLERRLRSDTGTFEAHVLSFADQSGYQDYLADPRRTEARRLLEGCAVQQRVLQVHDVTEQLPAEEEAKHQGSSLRLRAQVAEPVP